MSQCYPCSSSRSAYLASSMLERELLLLLLLLDCLLLFKISRPLARDRSRLWDALNYFVAVVINLYM